MKTGSNSPIMERGVDSFYGAIDFYPIPGINIKTFTYENEIRVLGEVPDVTQFPSNIYKIEAHELKVYNVKMNLSTEFAERIPELVADNSEITLLQNSSVIVRDESNQYLIKVIEKQFTIIYDTIRLINCANFVTDLVRGKKSFTDLKITDYHILMQNKVKIINANNHSHVIKSTPYNEGCIFISSYKLLMKSPILKEYVETIHNRNFLTLHGVCKNIAGSNFQKLMPAIIEYIGSFVGNEINRVPEQGSDHELLGGQENSFSDSTL